MTVKEEILINATPREVRAAVLSDGILQELLVERVSRSRLLGNIYRGHVTRVLPGMPKAAVQARILLTPQHAKGLMKALAGNLKKYEDKFGEIKTFSEKNEDKNFGFQSGSEEQ